MNTAAKAGTAGGALIVFITSITSADLLKTVVLTSVGAVISFTVSLLLKWITRKCSNEKKGPPHTQ